MSDKKKFLGVLKDEFGPRLREIGFKGSGQNFRRINNEIINIINVQGNKYGGSFAVNLGMHLTFLPNNWSSELPDIKKLKAYECEFVMRLAPNNKADYWWKYEGIAVNPEKKARHLITTYFKYGEENFQAFKSLDDFIKIFTIERLKKDKYAGRLKDKSLVRGALTMARIYEYIGQTQNAKIFANVGLENIGKATTLKPEFERILGL